jgi:hypothetical protein
MIPVRTESLDDLNQIIRKKIEILAYHKAEIRGLKERGHQVEDWLHAEEEVLSCLREA